MSNERFAADKQRVMRDGPPSSGVDLCGMGIDFAWYLETLVEIDGSSLVVRRTSDPDRLIEASCRARTGVSLTAAADAVRHVWLTRLRYDTFESHALTIEEDRAVLDCVTQIEPGGFFVTARVTAEAPAG